ncbi:unnamed protein product [Linum trigynum]|uniref:Xylanase inhibitor C-terminal domain-containing protein n=1 Tax=Linum trigynum TaxID=586398 RepID=A0AAV2FVQ1_9ROSI
MKSRKVDTFYYVALSGMSVGGELLSIPASVFELDEAGNGGVIVDCGTAITRLQTVCRGEEGRRRTWLVCPPEMHKNNQNWRGSEGGIGGGGRMVGGESGREGRAGGGGGRWGEGRWAEVGGGDEGGWRWAAVGGGVMPSSRVGMEGW